MEEGMEPLELTMSEWVDLVWATRNPWPDERRYLETRSGSFGWVGSQFDGAAEAVRRHLEGQEDIEALPLSRWTFDVSYTFSGTSELGELPRVVKSAFGSMWDVVVGDFVVRPLVAEGSDESGIVMEYTILVVARTESAALAAVRSAVTQALSGGNRRTPMVERLTIPRYLRDIRRRGPAEPLKDI
jgi:hypothetical protein